MNLKLSWSIDLGCSDHYVEFIVGRYRSAVDPVIMRRASHMTPTHVRGREEVRFLVLLKSIGGFAVASVTCLGLVYAICGIEPNAWAEYAAALAGGFAGYVFASSLHRASPGKRD